VHRVPGGKGLNVARAAHLLGADVAAVAVLGGPSGAWIAGELKRIRLPLCAVAGETPTRTCVSIADGGATMTELYEPATPVTGAEWSDLERQLAASLADKAGWLTISGSLPVGSPRGAMGSLIGIARRHNRKVAVDVEGETLVDALEAGPDLVKVNAAEAVSALGSAAGAGPGTLAELLAERTRIGAVVTAGIAGAHGHSHDHGPRYIRSAHRGAYPVGSGDCMLAALVTWLDRGANLSDALVTAGAVATANALKPGAACFDQQDVKLASATLEVGVALTGSN
jgi:1-phosphofructokinase/tagatose 6-phosphate kinase